ncbi:transposase domain-containing protein [Thalassospira sp. MBR-102]
MSCLLSRRAVCAYLKATLEAIAKGHPQSRIDELLPWNMMPSAEPLGRVT